MQPSDNQKVGDPKPDASGHRVLQSDRRSNSYTGEIGGSAPNRTVASALTWFAHAGRHDMWRSAHRRDGPAAMTRAGRATQKILVSKLAHLVIHASLFRDPMPMGQFIQLDPADTTRSLGEEFQFALQQAIGLGCHSRSYGAVTKCKESFPACHKSDGSTHNDSRARKHPSRHFLRDEKANQKCGERSERCGSEMPPHYGSICSQASTLGRIYVGCQLSS